MGLRRLSIGRSTKSKTATATSASVRLEHASVLALTIAMQQAPLGAFFAPHAIGTFLGTSGTSRKLSSVQRSTCDSHRLYVCLECG